MKRFGLRAAKSSLSAIVDAAERGEATTITRYGKPAAIVVPVQDARRLYPDGRPSLAALLLGIPHRLETERDPTPLRAAEL